MLLQPWRVIGLIAVLVASACAPGAGTPSVSPTATPSAASGTPAPGKGFQSGDKVTVVVPMAAGGGYDTYTRTAAPFFEQALRQVTGQEISVIVQNVVGAGGQLGVEQVNRAAPDGRTVALVGADVAASQQVLLGAAFDLRKMTPFAQIQQTEEVLLVRPGVLTGTQDFKALIERSKQKPVLYGISGNTATAILTLALLKDGGNELKTDIVRFQGTSEAIASLLRGEIEVYEVALPTALAQVKSNPSLKLLVNLGTSRSAQAPDVATMKEQGVARADDIAKVTGIARMFMGPPGMSAEVRSTIEEAFRIALTNQEFVSKSAGLNNPIAYANTSAVTDRVAAYIKIYESYKDLLK